VVGDARRAYLNAFTSVVTRYQTNITKGGQDAFVPAFFRAQTLQEFNRAMQGKIQAYATNRDAELINGDWSVKRVMKGSPLAPEVEKLMATGALEPVVKRSGNSVFQILQDFGIMDADAILQAMANHLGTEVVSLKGVDIPKAALAAIPGNSAKMYRCMPVSLDGTNGIELMKNLSGRPGSPPILAYSMHDESIYAERALRAGAKGYVMKQAAPEVLLSAIHQILKGKIFLTVPPDRQHIHVMLDEQQRLLTLATAPRGMEALHWGKQILGIRIDLHRADPAEVMRLVETAWRYRAPKRLAAAFDRDRPAPA
jgi:DNA-binding NarL/FixJ family response regulator